MKKEAVLTARGWSVVMGPLLVGSVGVLLFCLQFGTHWIGMSQMLELVSVRGHDGSVEPEQVATTAVILLQVRLPRLILGLLVGACLASVGVVLQALLRNPLADPYVLGVSSGAALGVTLALLVGLGSTVVAWSLLPLCGFAGGLLSLGLVYRLSHADGQLSIHSLLLAGVILNSIFSAVIMFITSVMDPTRAAGTMAWLMGTLTAPSPFVLAMIASYLLGGLTLLFRQARRLNILTLGEESARALGVDTEQVKRHVYLLAALMTGAIVSVSGMIGFVGMVIPHAVRLLLGADHRLLLPASALVGGMYLMLADTAARTLLSPTELPVGIITALAGGPFFIYLLVWRKDRFG